MASENPAEPLRSLRLPPDLVRSSDDRVLAGVCGGLGTYLGVDPTVVRLALVVLTFANGVGLLIYLVAWALLPSAPPTTSTGVPIIGSVSGAAPQARPRTAERAVGLGLVTLGLLVLFGHLGLLLPPGIVWAVAFTAVGFGLVWVRTDQVRRTKGLLARAVAGALLLLVGLATLFASGGVLSTLGQLGLAMLATVAGMLLLLGPWIVRLVNDLGAERRERIRSEERSEIAAHLHDSVLQTLALIQRHADAPGRARALARRQERELRAWLFDERSPDAEDGDLEVVLERVVTEVEDDHDVAVDLVVVGEAGMDPRLDALVAAVREAAQNAARHAGVGEVSIYVEVEPDEITAYVRDRGNGFDLDAVAPGRLGVRESIIGRMLRHGGTAEVHSTPGEGTEVVLRMRRAAVEHRPAADVRAAVEQEAGG